MNNYFLKKAVNSLNYLTIFKYVFHSIGIEFSTVKNLNDIEKFK